MSFSIVDRRPQGSGSTVGNKKRFIDKHKERIRRHIDEKRKYTGIKDKFKKVIIEGIKGIYHPSENIDSGETRTVGVNNDIYNAGDKIRKSPFDQLMGGAGKDANSDKFHEIILSDKEFLDIYFENWKLPNFIKKALITTETTYEKGGYSTTGSPALLDIKKTYKNSLSRKMALEFAKEEEVKRLKKEIKHCKDNKKISILKKELQNLEEYMIPFIDDKDVRYKSKYEVEISEKKALVILVLDISGSMTDSKLFLAKKSFQLLYWFLLKVYKNKVELRFIVHTTQAKEVDEKEFFSTRETGGTSISPAFVLAEKILNEDRYLGYNKYLFQASDGDNWVGDNDESCHLLESILKKLQYYMYVAINIRHNDANNFYKTVEDNFGYDEKVGTVLINDESDIFINIKELFEGF